MAREIFKDYIKVLEAIMRDDKAWTYLEKKYGRLNKVKDLYKLQDDLYSQLNTKEKEFIGFANKMGIYLKISGKRIN